MTLAEGGRSKKRTEDRNQHNGNGQREEYVGFRNFFISRKELWCTQRNISHCWLPRDSALGWCSRARLGHCTEISHARRSEGSSWSVPGKRGKADGINRCFLTCRESLQLPPFCVRLHCRLQLQKLCPPGISAF